MSAAESADIAAAVAVLRAGGLVAFPTETVYGLGADARQPAAVRRVFTVKGRPPDHPLIVHLGDGEMMSDWAAVVPSAASGLTAAFWPGPLTVLVPRHPRVSTVVTGGRGTVGLRVPGHPMARKLLHAFGGGIAAPSANRFGKVSPTTAQHVRDDLGDDVDLVIDGGPCTVGVESTIVDCTVVPPMILRHGGVTTAEIEQVLGTSVQAAVGPSRAPGMLASHYAPACAVELAATAALGNQRAAVLERSGRKVDVLDPGPDPIVFARGLYGWLRAADQRGLDVLVVVVPPDEGLGRAVNDRLWKASAPHPT